MSEFWIQHRYSESGFYIDPHFEHRYQGIVVLKGRVNYHVGEQSYLLTPGDMIVLNTLENHTLEVLEYPYERYIFQIAPAFFQHELQFPEIISIFVCRTPGFSHACRIPADLWPSFCRNLQEMDGEYQNQNTYWKLMVGCKLRQLFIPLFRALPEAFSPVKPGANTALVFEVQNYLNQHYQEDLSMEQLAAQFFVNKSYLSHLFKAVTGYSVKQFLIALRLNCAKALLVQTDETVSEIAGRCGYTDFAHFSRLFRKNENCSPSEFRKRSSMGQPSSNMDE